LQFPRITEEAIAELRARIGEEVRPPMPWVEEATKDAIRHYALGIGDRNPLFLDEAYAAHSVVGTIVAPPTMLYAFDRIVSGYVGGLPGVHAMYAGAHFRFHRWVRRNDRIRAQSWLHDVIDRSSAFSGRAIQQIYRTRFTNQDGQEVAEVDSWCFRTQRDEARQRGKYARLEPYTYTQEELERIWADYDREEIRGATPRYFEDVELGERLVPVVKGPLTATSVIAYAQGWGGLYIRAHAYARDLFRTHPALAIPNAQNVPEPPERVHWDSEFARRVGVPLAYDYGPERVSWMGHLLTNWMGDAGFLAELRVEIRRFNLLGDTHWCHGEVVDKQPLDSSRGQVRCNIWAEDQRGEITARGFAQVILPRRPVAGRPE
jgi:acyl dehydratase